MASAPPRHLSPLLPAGGWSPWFGASLASPTDATQGQTCPCGTFVTQWRVWQAAGKVTLVGDKDPLNGILAVCSNGAVLNVSVNWLILDSS